MHNYWWLVESYLIDGIGIVSWLFGEFFHARWNILFSRGGEYARWDWTQRLKWTLENSELGKTQISFLGGGDLWWVGWGMWCEVGYTRWGMRGGLRKVGLGEVGYASHLVRFFTLWYSKYLYHMVGLFHGDHMVTGTEMILHTVCPMFMDFQNWLWR